MKLKYSEPKIYTGGVDISMWSKLTKTQKDKALKKDWFVYFSFRNPKTGKLEKQPFIKAGANKLKTKTDRYRFLKTMQKALSELLSAGFNPYEDNTELEAKIFNTNDPTESKNEKSSIVNSEVDASPKNDTLPIEPVNDQPETLEKIISIAEAFTMGLELKQRMMNKNSFKNFKSRIHLFQKWLLTKKIQEQSITHISKKLVSEYLNDVLLRTSTRNRNNSRTDIGSLFQILEDNEIIRENFVKKIPVLKSTPKRNKTYTPKQQKDIYDYLEKEDPHLLLFIKFISYGFLRPIEICRLRIEDVDVEDKKLYVKAKNSPVKVKIIPEILMRELPDLSACDPKHFLFTQDGIGGVWDIDQTNKRGLFTDRFKKVKEHFKLGEEYGLYSFRHTFITKLYRELRQTASPYETKSSLMLITGHSTMAALEKYLRDIDAELPQDYSSMLDKKYKK